MERGIFIFIACCIRLIYLLFCSVMFVLVFFAIRRIIFVILIAREFSIFSSVSSLISFLKSFRLRLTSSDINCIDCSISFLPFSFSVLIVLFWSINALILLFITSNSVLFLVFDYFVQERFFLQCLRRFFYLKSYHPLFYCKILLCYL